MKKILYISHVAWGWIKQRPQFIAEELQEHYAVDVYYGKSNKYSNANREFSEGNLRVKGFRFWPFERITLLPIPWTDKINLAIFKNAHINMASYDYIWITDPRHYFLIKNEIKKQKLIYDCMDDMLEFPYIKKYSNLYTYETKAEEQLIRDADAVLCSASSLNDKLVARYGIEREYHIVNNAITDDVASYIVNRIEMPPSTLVYVGTISAWFDFESVIAVLDRFPNLHVWLYGPIRMSDPPVHDRLEYKGVIEHKEIVSVMNAALGLIMPFVVNELIVSVNPVKLYEYIYTGKPICAVKYKETEKFSEYVTLYSNKEQFVEFARKCLEGAVFTNKEAMRSYAIDNTWKSRAAQIKTILESLHD